MAENEFEETFMDFEVEILSQNFEDIQILTYYSDHVAEPKENSNQNDVNNLYLYFDDNLEQLEDDDRKDWIERKPALDRRNRNVNLTQEEKLERRRQNTEQRRRRNQDEND